MSAAAAPTAPGPVITAATAPQVAAGISRRPLTPKKHDVANLSSRQTYASLIALALFTAPERRLTLSAIYAFVGKHKHLIPTANQPNWKNSIRHNLSLRPCFVKVPRRSHEGKKLCSLWELDVTCLPFAARATIEHVAASGGALPSFLSGEPEEASANDNNNNAPAAGGAWEQPPAKSPTPSISSTASDPALSEDSVPTSSPQQGRKSSVRKAPRQSADPAMPSPVVSYAPVSSVGPLPLPSFAMPSFSYSQQPPNSYATMSNPMAAYAYYQMQFQQQYYMQMQAQAQLQQQAQAQAQAQEQQQQAQQQAQEQEKQPSPRASPQQ